MTRYIHHIPDTTKAGLPTRFVSSAKKFVPKRLHTNVAGRNSIPRVAMVFMAMLSVRVSSAIVVLCSAILRLVMLSRFAVKLYNCLVCQLYGVSIIVN